MIIRDLEECTEFTAGDKTILRELLHADKTEKASFRYSLAHATVRQGEQSKPHALRTSEVYYILEGQGEMHIGDEAAPVRSGQAIVIPPKATQYIRNIGSGDLKFLCIVDPAWKISDESVF